MILTFAFSGLSSMFGFITLSNGTNFVKLTLPLYIPENKQILILGEQELPFSLVQFWCNSHRQH